MRRLFTILALLCAMSFTYNLFAGWTWSVGEATVTHGIKRNLGLNLYVQKVPYDVGSGLDRQEWYYEFGLDQMFYSYKVNGLENDDTIPKITRLLGHAWRYWLPIVLLGWVIMWRQRKPTA